MKIIVQVQYDGCTARKIKTADGLLTVDDALEAYFECAKELNLPAKGIVTPDDTVEED